jgi:hypothetical protein
MTDESKLAYLSRAFDRLRDNSISDAQMSRQRVMRKAARVGALQSGRTLLCIQEEYVRVVREAATKMARQAFDATGTNNEEVAKLIQEGLSALRDALSNDLAEFFRKGGSWAGNLGQSLGNEFLNQADKVISGVVDDFHHRILEGTRLTKDPLVSVISAITNSPGAVMQSGVGNVQTVFADGTDALRSALGEFLNSREVQGLTPEDKQSVADVADVISTELSKPNADASKLARWGTRLVGLAEKLGISVAASGLSKLLLC